MIHHFEIVRKVSLCMEGYVLILHMSWGQLIIFLLGHIFYLQTFYDFSMLDPCQVHFFCRGSGSLIPAYDVLVDFYILRSHHTILLGDVHLVTFSTFVIHQYSFDSSAVVLCAALASLARNLYLTLCNKLSNITNVGLLCRECLERSHMRFAFSMNECTFL